MISEAVKVLKKAKHVTAFTGAGISVESGIPPFRGENGLWNTFNPEFLDIDYFHKYPLKSWELIKEIFYDFFGEAEPNIAHVALAEMEQLGYLDCIITQNIDNLHHKAGSKNILEFHGTSRNLICSNCKRIYSSENIDFSLIPPRCDKCKTVLKPDFVFFGEQIPEPVGTNSFLEAEIADVFLLIGTTGEIMPASLIPINAKDNNVKIIEINIETSNYTNKITDLFLEGKATKVMAQLLKSLKQ